MRKLAILFVRLLSIFIIITRVSYLPSIISLMFVSVTSPDMLYTWLPNLIYIGLALLLAALLFIYAKPISNFLIGSADLEEESVAVHIREQVLYDLLLFGLAIWIIFGAFPDLLKAVIGYMQMNTDGHISTREMQHFIRDILSYGFNVLFGCIVLFLRKNISSFFISQHVIDNPLTFDTYDSDVE